MKLEGFGDSSLKPRTVDQIKGQVFAGEQLQRLAADILHHLFRLGAGKAAGANFTEGQIHNESQVPEIAVFFPDGLL